MIEEKELIDLCKKEDTKERGYRILMTLYQERLYCHIHHMLGNHEDTDDVLQNTFIKAFRNIDAFEMRSGLYSWLYRIATNEALSFLRSKKRQANNVAREDYSQIQKSSDQKSEVFLDEDEIIIRLSLATAALPPQQQRIFEMRYFDNMSYTEMAKKLNLSEGGLKASYHLAVKKIENFLKG